MKSLIKRLFPLLVLAAVAGLSAGGPGFAGKGGGKGGGGNGGSGETPIPGGTIYYHDWLDGFGDGVLAKMNTDGSGKELLPLTDGDEPSNLLYGEGSRWLLKFLDTNPEQYTEPVWNEEYELFAIDEAGNAIQLTDVSSTAVYYANDMYGAKWSNDGIDSFVSFTANDANGSYLWRLNVSVADFTDPGWTPVGLADDRFELAAYEPQGAIMWHDSSPDGRQSAYVLSNDGGTLKVQDIDGGAAQTLVVGGARHVRWSPAGSQLAFDKQDDGVWTVNSDGTDVRQILAPKNGGRRSRYYGLPHWSPDGTHLVVRVTDYDAFTGGVNHWDNDIGRVAADGSGLTLLTDISREHSYWVRPQGWRANVHAMEIYGP